MSLDTTALAGAFQQILLTFAQHSLSQTSLYWAVVRATEQLSAVVDQQRGPSGGSKGRVSGDDTGSMNVDRKDEPDLPKKLLLEAAMRMRLPPSIPPQWAPQSPIATTDEEMGNDETRVHETSVFTDEKQEDATIEHGKLMFYDRTSDDIKPCQIASSGKLLWRHAVQMAGPRRGRCWAS